MDSSRIAMNSVLVIKVKYGDNLRRFSAHVDENNQLDLNMTGLKTKICSIFGFPVNANFILRYVDEDGDLVNLVDDDDLHDVMWQKMKFLRIDIHMINDCGGKSDAGGTSESTTPLVTPLSLFLGDALSALPESSRQALYSSLSKAASSSPVLANLADSISKIGLSILNPHSQQYVAGGTSSKNGVPKEIVSEAKGPQSPYVDSSNARDHGAVTPLSGNVVNAGVSYSVPEPIHESLANVSLSKDATSGHVLPCPTDSISKMGQSTLNSHCQPHLAAGPISKNGVPEEPTTSEAKGPQSPFLNSASDVNWQVEAGNMIRGFMAASSGSQQVEDGNKIRSVTEASSGSSQLEAGNMGITPADPNILPLYGSPVSWNILSSNDKSEVSINDSFAGKDEACVKPSNSATTNSRPVKNSARGSGVPSECPFSGMLPPPGHFGYPPFKRSHSHTVTMNGTFHKGVRCDGCGVYPITGSRFTSKIKENYDLCSICFNEIGNMTDYVRMDRPASAKELRSPLVQSHIFKTGSLLKHEPRLDSLFILDVNVIDGTMMAPSTAFTKIWRMRNNGTLVWPKGTQLVWIGGDQFSDCHFTDLEVPEDGLPMEKELDIAVHFRAPQLPGRYISYWRMASPSGHKFGQRVWVLIQVDAHLNDSFYHGSQTPNLNSPVAVSGSKGPQFIDINVRPIEDDTFHQPQIPNAPPEPVNQMVLKESKKELENEATFASSAASLPTTSVAPSTSYPIVDFSNTTPAVHSIQQTSTAASPPATSSVSYPIVDFSSTSPFVPSLSSSSGMGETVLVEEALLKELELMGFKQVDLNKEILRINEYDLEQSVEDLCDASQQGVSKFPILGELHEMGFHDREKNKRLLQKHNGSIKRVVMDLINGEQV